MKRIDSTYLDLLELAQEVAINLHLVSGGFADDCWSSLLHKEPVE